MRFSTLFQSGPFRLNREGDRAAVSGEAAPLHPPEAPAAQDLPEDLDARVRLLGEWQVSEY